MNSSNNNTNSNNTNSNDTNNTNDNSNNFVRPGPWSAFEYVLILVLISYCHVIELY
jgi:hypothetical protein